MEKKIVELPLITYEDLCFNEMIWLALMLGGEVFREKKDKTEAESYVIQIYEIVVNVLSCYTCIDQASHFIRHRPTLRELDENEGMTVLEYYNYHYDVVIHKLSTIRDLSFKLINKVFRLNLDDKNCNWASVWKKKNLITIPNILNIQRLFYYSMIEIEKNRNESSHNGILNNMIFREIDIFILLSQMKRRGMVPDTVLNYDPIAKGTYNDYLLRKKKQELLKKIDYEKATSLFYIHMLTCCISRKFKSEISQTILDKYSTVIQMANHQIDTYDRKINKLEYVIPYLLKINEILECLKKQENPHLNKILGFN